MDRTKNFSELRSAHRMANPPCIPFLGMYQYSLWMSTDGPGVYLSDLVFINDAPSLTPSELINFKKRTQTADAIREIQQFQNVPYHLQPVPELQDYILSNIQAATDINEMYPKSLAVEPREREDEKIARYEPDRETSTLTVAAVLGSLR